MSGYIETSTDVDVIFLDFAKAFDKVPHQNHGVDGKIIVVVVVVVVVGKVR